jgi:Tfp pilus assembly protein PilF
VEEADRRRALRKAGSDLSAYDLLLRGKHRLEKGGRQDVLAAREMFERVIEIDPDWAPGYVELAESYFYEAISDWSDAPQVAVEKVFELGHEATRLDPQESRARLCLAFGHLRLTGNLELAKAQVEAAIALNPNDLDNYCLKGFILPQGLHLDLYGRARGRAVVYERGDPARSQHAGEVPAEPRHG